jgi:hypothetical protein
LDSHKRSTQLERFEVEETGRRRRWSNDEKLRIVMESFEAPRDIVDGETPWHITFVAPPAASLCQSTRLSRQDVCFLSFRVGREFVD